MGSPSEDSLFFKYFAHMSEWHDAICLLVFPCFHLIVQFLVSEFTGDTLALPQWNVINTLARRALSCGLPHCFLQYRLKLRYPGAATSASTGCEALPPFVVPRGSGLGQPTFLGGSPRRLSDATPPHRASCGLPAIAGSHAGCTALLRKVILDLVA